MSRDCSFSLSWLCWSRGRGQTQRWLKVWRVWSGWRVWLEEWQTSCASQGWEGQRGAWPSSVVISHCQQRASLDQQRVSEGDFLRCWSTSAYSASSPLTHRLFEEPLYIPRWVLVGPEPQVWIWFSVRSAAGPRRWQGSRRPFLKLSWRALSEGVWLQLSSAV